MLCHQREGVEQAAAACGNRGSGVVADSGSTKAGLLKVTRVMEKSNFPSIHFRWTYELTPSIAPTKVQYQWTGL